MGSPLSTLVANCAIDLGDPSLQFYTTPEIQKAIGDSFQQYTIWMIEEGEGYFELPVNLGFTAQVETIDLSTLTPPIFNVAKLERRTSQGTIPLKKNERRFTPNFTINTGVGDTYQPSYNLRGLNLVLEPMPQNTEVASNTTGLVLKYNYLPPFPTSTSASNFTFDPVFPIIYEPMVCTRAVIQVLETKDAMGGVSDINSFRTRLEQQEESFGDSLERSEYPDSVAYIGMSYNNNYNWR